MIMPTYITWKNRIHQNVLLHDDKEKSDNRMKNYLPFVFVGTVILSYFPFTFISVISLINIKQKNKNKYYSEICEEIIMVIECK